MSDRNFQDADLTGMGEDSPVQPARFTPLDAAEARTLRARAARRDVTERRRVTARLREALAENGLLLLYITKRFAGPP